MKGAKHKAISPDLAGLITAGVPFEVRVTPRASRDRLVISEGAISVYVTNPPEDGRANAAVQVLLAKALGVAKSRLTLVRGHTARQKQFRLD